MATLENFTRSGRVTGKYTGRVNQDYTAPTLSKLFRSGTGRRRKPVDPSETSYERRMQIYSPPFGHGSETPLPGTTTKALQWVGPHPSWGGNFSKGLVSPTGVAPNSNVLDLAVLKALNKLNLKDLDLGTAWAERSKTADLVRSTAVTAAKALHAIGRRDGRGLLNALGLSHEGSRGKGVVDAYLAYHYGLKPLLQDVAGAVQALTRMPQGEWRVTVVGRHSENRSRTDVLGTDGYSSFMSFSTVNEKAQSKISAIPRPLSRVQDMAWSLGLDNRLATSWELVPYSFVVDWVLPIGDYITACNSLKYYTGWLVCNSQVFRESARYSGHSHVQAGMGTTSNISGGLYQALHLRRSISGGPPIPALPIKDPSSIDKMAKSLALLASASHRAGQQPRFLRY